MSQPNLTSKDKPHIKYTSKDYESILEELVNLAQKKLPEWTDLSSGDPGMVLMECFAYMADVMLYYQDRIAQECFPHTAVEKRNVKSLLRLIGYEFRGAFPARTILKMTLPFKNIKDSKIKVQIEDGMQFFATGIEGVDRVMFMFHPDIERLYFDRFIPGQSYEFFAFDNQLNSKMVRLQEPFGEGDEIYFLSTSKMREPRRLTPQADYTVRKTQGRSGRELEEDQIVIHSSFLEKIDRRLSVVPILVEHKKKGNPSRINLYLPAIQAEESREIVKISDGTPNQKFNMKIPTIQGVEKYWIQNEIEVKVAARDNETLVKWKRRENFLDSHPKSLHYYVQLDENDKPTVFFGDGVNGAIPPLGSEIRIRFLKGLGEKGNIAKGLIRHAYLDAMTTEGGKLGEVEIVNVTPAIGGKDPEQSREAIRNAPWQLKTMERAVTREDYEYLIKSNFPEVNDVIVKRGPIYKIVIYVLFQAEIEKDEKAVEQSLKDIQNFLEEYRMLTVFIELRRASQMDINVRADVHLKGEAQQDEEWYKQRIYEKIESVVRDLTLVEEPIHKSKIIHAIHTVEDVDFVENVQIDYDRTKAGEPSYIMVVRAKENLRIIYSGS